MFLHNLVCWVNSLWLRIALRYNERRYRQSLQTIERRAVRWAGRSNMCRDLSFMRSWPRLRFAFYPFLGHPGVNMETLKGKRLNDSGPPPAWFTWVVVAIASCFIALATKGHPPFIVMGVLTPMLATIFLLARAYHMHQFIKDDTSSDECNRPLAIAQAVSLYLEHELRRLKERLLGEHSVYVRLSDALGTAYEVIQQNIARYRPLVGEDVVTRQVADDALAYLQDASDRCGKARVMTSTYRRLVSRYEGGCRLIVHLVAEYLHAALEIQETRRLVVPTVGLDQRREYSYASDQ